jgi:hypothetical protein
MAKDDKDNKDKEQTPPLAAPPPEGLGTGPAQKIAELERQLAAVKGEKEAMAEALASKNADAEALRVQNAALKDKITTTRVPLIEDLPADAAELKESVTLPPIQKGGIELPRQCVNLGHIVTTGDANALQTKVGTKTKVFYVNKQVMAELQAAGHLW